MVTTRSQTKKVTTETTSFSSGPKKGKSKGKNGGKTSPLMIALGVLALGLVIAIVVVLVNRNKKDKESATKAPGGTNKNSQFCSISLQCLLAGTGQPSGTIRQPGDTGFIPIPEILSELAKINGVTIPAESNDQTPLIEVDADLTGQELIDLLLDLNLTNPNGDIIQLGLFGVTALEIPGLSPERKVYAVNLGQTEAGEDYTQYLGEPTAPLVPGEGGIILVSKTAFPNGCPANCSF